MDETEARLREIGERCERATTGPWYPGRADMQSYDGMTGGAFTNIYVDSDKKRHSVTGGALPRIVARTEQDLDEPEADNNKADADFIAHARADIPWLLALVARLRRERG